MGKEKGNEIALVSGVKGLGLGFVGTRCHGIRISPWRDPVAVAGKRALGYTLAVAGKRALGYTLAVAGKRALGYLLLPPHRPRYVSVGGAGFVGFSFIILFLAFGDGNGDLDRPPFVVEFEGNDGQALL